MKKIIFALVFLSMQVTAASWYVRVGGSGDTLTTFQEALDSLKADDSVYVNGDAVFEVGACLIADMNGGANPIAKDSTSIYIVGCEPDWTPYTDTLAMVKCSVTVALDSMLSIVGANTSNLIFSNFWFYGTDQCGVGVYTGEDVSDITFKRCKFSGFTGRILNVRAPASNGQSWKIISCSFYGGSDGVYSPSTNRAQFNIYFSHFDGMTGVAIETSSGVSTEVIGNTIANVGTGIYIPYSSTANGTTILNNGILHARYGLDIVQNAPFELQIHNNSFQDCDTAVFTHNTNAAKYYQWISYNNYYGNTADCDINGSSPLGEYNMAVDPKYTDTTAATINMVKDSTSSLFGAGVFNPHIKELGGE